MADIKTELENYNIILSVLPTYYYSEAITHIIDNLKDYKICYVDLNKGTDALLKSFKLNNIDTKNIFFIDGITLSVNPKAKLDNAILLSSPYALTEMGIAISEVLKTGAFEILVFDSLSTLNVYAKEISGVSGKFASSLINKLRSNKNKGLLTCLEHDINTDLIRQSSLFVDKVLQVSSFLEDKINTNKYKATALIASLLAFSVLSLFYTGTNNLTGFAVAEGANIRGIAGAIFPVSLLAVILAVISLLALYTKKKPKIKTVQANIPERKSPDVKNQFRAKINKWLKGIKALGLF